LAIVTRILVALLGLTLSGCWTGDAYLTSRDAFAVIPDGRYKLDQEIPDELLTFKRQPDNSYVMTGPEQPWRLTLAQLASGRPNRFVVQAQMMSHGRTSPSGALYMLVDREPAGLRAYLLGCDGVAREAVEKSGGTIARDPNSAATCRFKDRRTLFEMLTRARPEEDRESFLLTRVGA